MKKYIIISILISCTVLFNSCNFNKENSETLKKEPSAYSGIHKVRGSFNFIIVSDWGWNGFKYQQQVADAMTAFSDSVEPRFIVSCGDNFQVNGVASTQDPLWNSNFENIYRTPSLLVDWYPVLGNHDYHGNTQAEIDYSKISRRWRMTAHYYSFAKKINDSVSIRFIFLDTPPFIEEYRKHAENYPDIVKQDTLQQILWLKELLSKSKEQWKIAFGHHPVYSASSFHGNTKELIQHLKPIFEKYHVQFYICGHDHDLQHLHEKDGTVDYIVTGAGGEPRRDSTNAMTLFSKSVPSFTWISLKADSLLLSFIDSKGNLVYRYVRKFK